MLCLVLIMIMAFVVAWPAPGRSAELARVVTRLREVDAVLRAGGHDWTAGRESLSGLEDVLAEAWAAGVPLVAGLTALRLELGKAIALIKAGRSTQVLLWARAALGIGLALGVRFALTREWRPTWIDLGSGLFAAAPMVAAAKVVARLVPLPWQLMSGETNSWLKGYLHGGEFSAVPRIDELGDQELLRGVSLLEEKRALLTEWSADQLAAGQERLKRLEDWLPVFELFGVGLPMVVLLAGPLAGWLERTL